MKTQRLSYILILMLAFGIGLLSCNKVKDADLQKAGELIIQKIPGASNVSITVKDHVATLSGVVEDEATKQKITSAVSSIEGLKSVINKISVVPPPPVVEEPVVEEVSNQLVVATLRGKLNVRDKPGVDEYVVMVVNRGDVLTLIEKTNDKWWLIETENGVKGYCYSPYLEEK